MDLELSSLLLGGEEERTMLIMADLVSDGSLSVGQYHLCERGGGIICWNWQGSQRKGGKSEEPWKGLNSHCGKWGSKLTTEIQNSDMLIRPQLKDGNDELCWYRSTGWCDDFFLFLCLSFLQQDLAATVEQPDSVIHLELGCRGSNISTKGICLISWGVYETK